MLISTVAYKINSSDYNWTKLPIQNSSIQFSEKSKQNRPGTTFPLTIMGYIPHITNERDEEYARLAAAGGLFLLMNANGDRYYCGNDALRANFEYEKVDGGKPGSKSGYQFEITLFSPDAALFQSFNAGAPAPIFDPELPQQD